MNIKPVQSVSSYKTGHLCGLTVEQINKALGMEKPNLHDDPYKVKHSWGFEADGIPCAIWDWKGSEVWGEFSCFGPPGVFIELFGQNCFERY